jgi:hypothetical protein
VSFLIKWIKLKSTIKRHSYTHFLRDFLYILWEMVLHLKCYFAQFAYSFAFFFLFQNGFKFTGVCVGTYYIKIKWLLRKRFARNRYNFKMSHISSKLAQICAIFRVPRALNIACDDVCRNSIKNLKYILLAEYLIEYFSLQGRFDSELSRIMTYIVRFVSNIWITVQKMALWDAGRDFNGRILC